ncbi:MAG: hypothetical protein IM638_19710 [Bacteroidetes bacterium]|nr:hypothetical protein [Bacteroidota bacterium]
MPVLTNLVRSLTKYEIRMVRSIIAMSGKRESSKRDQLFEKLLTGINDEQAAQQIGYKHARISAYINLSQRLQDDILNALLLCEQSNDEEMPFLQAQSDCRRALLHAGLLQSRSCFEEADAMLERTLRTARRSELFAEQLLLNDLRRNTPQVQQNPELFNEISTEIRRLHALQADVLGARQLHYEMLSPGLICSVSMADFQSKGMQRLNELGKRIGKGSSVRMNFYYQLSAMNFYYTIRSFDEAAKHGGELLKLIESNAMLHTQSNVTAVCVELASISLAQGQHAAAAGFAEQAMDNAPSAQEQYLHAARMLALAHFREANYTAAANTISQTLNTAKVRQFPLPVARLELLHAAVALQEKAYHSSAKLLARCGELMNDYKGWMAGFFLTDMQLNLERGMLDVASHRLDAFRYSVRRFELDKNPNDKRLVTILQLLQKLVRLNLGFDQLDKQEAERISLLRQNENDFWWNPAGYELIRFDQWITRCYA